MVEIRDLLESPVAITALVAVVVIILAHLLFSGSKRPKNAPPNAYIGLRKYQFSFITQPTSHLQTPTALIGNYIEFAKNPVSHCASLLNSA